MKIWPGFDDEVARAVRQRFPDILLQVDANSAYTMANWRRLQALDDLDLLLIEQPLFDDDIVLHSEISRELRTPVCLDESIHSLRDAQAAATLWERNGALDRLIINIKPPRVSGFAEAIAIARFCHEKGIRTWIGGMLDSAWGKAMNLNFNGLPEIDLPGDHFSPGGAYFVEDVTETPLVAEAGQFALGDGVSAGVAFDWPRFERMGQVVDRMDVSAVEGSVALDALADHGAGHDRDGVRHLEVPRLDDGHPPAQALDMDAVGDLEHLGHVVADQDDRQAAVAHLANQVEHHVRLLDAQRRGRLVHDHDVPRKGGAARHRDALPLPAGERLDRLAHGIDPDLEILHVGARFSAHPRLSSMRSSDPAMPGRRSSRPRKRFSAMSSAGATARS